MNNYIIYLQIFSTCALFGLILTIQFVHYPSFLFISPENFKKFHNFHTQKITLIVAPLMLVEIITALMLWLMIPSNLTLANLASVFAIWIFTASLSVPIHNALSKAHNPKLIKKLIATNWLRTITWGLRVILLIKFYELLV